MFGLLLYLKKTLSILQAAHLLQAPKSSPDDLASISSTCFKLNSLQLRELLENYIPEPMEPPIPHNLIDRVVSVAENMADDLIRSDGRVVQMQEDRDLQLPFLLPEDGYSCDTIKGMYMFMLFAYLSSPFMSFYFSIKRDTTFSFTFGLLGVKYLVSVNKENLNLVWCNFHEIPSAFMSFYFKHYETH